jgi:hypothetical protein
MRMSMMPWMIAVAVGFSLLPSNYQLAKRLKIYANVRALKMAVAV